MIEYCLELSAKQDSWFGMNLYDIEDLFPEEFTFHESGMHSEAAGWYTADLVLLEKLVAVCIEKKIPHSITVIDDDHPIWPYCELLYSTRYASVMMKQFNREGFNELMNASFECFLEYMGRPRYIGWRSRTYQKAGAKYLFDPFDLGKIRA